MEYKIIGGFILLGLIFLFVWFVGYLVKGISPNKKEEYSNDVDATSHVSTHHGDYFGSGDASSHDSHTEAGSGNF